jgi:hypothetical protein
MRPRLAVKEETLERVGDWVAILDTAGFKLERGTFRATGSNRGCTVIECAVKDVHAVNVLSRVNCGSELRVCQSAKDAIENLKPTREVW